MKSVKKPMVREQVLSIIILEPMKTEISQLNSESRLAALTNKAWSVLPQSKMQDDEGKAVGLVQVRLLRPKVLDKEEIRAVYALNRAQVKMELQ